jgi:hypothetical protein
MSTRIRWDTVLVHIGWQADSRSVEPVNTRQKITPT